jgi:membrane-associated phospholipid phosphatase
MNQLAPEPFPVVSDAALFPPPALPLPSPARGALWRLCRALTRQIYALYICAAALVLLWPHFSGGIAGTPAWRLLLDLTVYEVVLVDVLCKRYIPWRRPLQLRNGFPSGHATYSFAVACLVGALHPVLAPLFYGMAAAISLSRVYLQGHFFYQVLGGAGLGIALAYLVMWR